MFVVVSVAELGSSNEFEKLMQAGWGVWDKERERTHLRSRQERSVASLLMRVMRSRAAPVDGHSQ
jgi:hypothetical protein